MTVIRYDDKQMTVTVQGHAGSGAEGKDLVCAGVSTLTWTLIQVLEDAKAAGYVKRLEWKYTDGDARIRVRAADGRKSIVKLMIMTICRGYEWLETNYRENVHCEKI